jgi:biotin carboxyl carrier protein
MAKLSVTIDGRTFVVEVSPAPADGAALTARVDGVPLEVYAPPPGGPEPLDWVVVDGRPYELVVDDDLRRMRSHNGLHRIEVRDMEGGVARPPSGDGRVKAPIPGLIARVMVQPGDAVVAGQPLLVLEAMKMENEIRAPRGGVVQLLGVSPGQAVALGAVLVEIG